MAELTHFNESGRARMVDVTHKPSNERVARAQGKVFVLPETLEKIQQGRIAKGDVLAVAQVAGVMGAKQTSHLIPMCHPLNLTGVDITFDIQPEPFDMFADALDHSGVAWFASGQIPWKLVTDPKATVDGEDAVSRFQSLCPFNSRLVYYCLNVREDPENARAA